MILIKKAPAVQSKYGRGMVIRCTFKCIEPDDGKIYFLDVYEGHSKSARFFKTGLKPQSIFSNMKVLKSYGGKFIDGTCDFRYEGIRKSQ